MLQALRAAFAIAVVTLSSASIASAQEPLGGPPPPGVKPSVSDLDAQAAHQRAGHLHFYRTQHAARTDCPDDQIVWASTSSRTLYRPGNPHYQHTHGGYVCESAARAKGYRGPTAHG
jgi:hypothetical protein